MQQRKIFQLFSSPLFISAGIIIVIVIASLLFAYVRKNISNEVAGSLKSADITSLSQKLISLNAQYASASESEAPKILQGMKIISQERMRSLIKLMQSSPDKAPAKFLPQEIISQFPEEIQKNLEQKKVVTGQLYAVVEFNEQLINSNKSNVQQGIKRENKTRYSIKTQDKKQIDLVFTDQTPNFSTIKDNMNVSLTVTQLGTIALVSAKDNSSSSYFKNENQFEKKDVKAAADAILTDIDVTYIERTPKYNFDSVKNNPDIGETVHFLAHVKNYSNLDTGIFDYYWNFDGVNSVGAIRNIGPGEEVTVDFPWVWDDPTHTHTLTFTADPLNRVVEQTKNNNQISIKTNSLMVGLWVEASLYNWFRIHQKELGVGSNSWEDWAQRQMTEWNKILEQSSYPEDNLYVKDRVRLEKVVVVPDGSLPLAGGLATNHPDLRDKTIDMMWGFPNGTQNNGFYGTNGVPNLNYSSCVSDFFCNPFYIEHPLMHELSHARYLVDWYQWNLNVQKRMDDVLVTKSDGSRFIMPEQGVLYQCEGGMMSCSVPYNRIFYYSKEDVIALNLKAYKRARCGNVNASCDLGEFLFNVPAANSFKILDMNGNPIANATVNFYQSVAEPTQPKLDFYDKYIDNTSDLEGRTDASGVFTTTQNPFGVTTSQGFWDITAEGVVFIKVTKNNQQDYKFMYYSDLNMEYYKGNKNSAMYTINTKIDPSRYTPEDPTPTPPTPTPSMPAPFRGTPAAIPGKIEAEDFDLGGQGIAYYYYNTFNGGAPYRPGELVVLYSTNDGGSGYYVFGTVFYDWLAYTVVVAQAGSYTFELRGSTDAVNHGPIHLELDGNQIEGSSIRIPLTDWDSWLTLSTNITLPAGKHVLKLVIDQEGVAINYMNFKIDTPVATPTNTPTPTLTPTLTPTDSPTPTLTVTPTINIQPTFTITPTPNNSDTIPPSITIVSPRNNETIGKYKVVQILAKASDASGIKSISIIMDNNVKTGKLCTNPIFPYSCSLFYDFKTGVHTIKVVAIDKANPANTASSQITVIKN